MTHIPWHIPIREDRRPRDGGAGGVRLAGSGAGHGIVIEEIAKGCYVTAMAVMGEVGVQCKILDNFAPKSIKQRLLPGVCTADVILAVCMTEPHAGTDVANYRTNADIVGDKLVLNGVKTLISRVDEAQGFSYSAVSTSSRPRRHRLRPDRARHAGIRVHRALSHDGRRESGRDPVPELRVAPREPDYPRSRVPQAPVGAFNTQRCLNPSISLGLAEAAFE